MKKTTFIKIFIFCACVAVVASCSTDRLIPLTIEKLNEADFYAGSYSPILNSLVSYAQKVTVKSDKDLPIKTAKGTNITIYNTNLRTANYSSIDYPFDVEYIELYTLKDMLIYRKPTVSFNELLTTGGAIYLNATKDGQNLITNEYYPPAIQIPAQKVDNEMLLFYGGYDRGEQFTWIRADSSRGNLPFPGQERRLIIAGRDVYEIFPRKLGWINCDKFTNYQGPKTFISVTSPQLNLDYISVFVVFPNINSIIQIQQGQSMEVPVGEPIKVIALAQTKTEQIYAYYDEMKVSENLKIEVILTKTTEEEFKKMLDNL